VRISENYYKPIGITFLWFVVLLWTFKNIGNLHSFSSILQATNHLDVGWYQRIAVEGYKLHPHISDGQSTVFFPLFPMIASPLIHVLGLDPLLALNILQKLSLILMVVLVYRWALLEKFSPKESLLALLLHPALVFFLVPYTESLYLCCLFGLLLSWRIKNVGFILFSALLLGLCRPTGLFVIPAAGFTLLHRAYVSLHNSEQRGKMFSYPAAKALLADFEFRATLRFVLSASLGAVLAVGLVALVMHLSVGDWFAFYRYRYLWNETPGFQNFVSFLNLDLGSRFPRIIVTWLALWGSYLLLQAGRVFEGFLCIVSLLLPAYQGKMGDIIRYSLGAAPAWIMLYERSKHSRIIHMSLIAFSTSTAIALVASWLKREWVG